MIFLPAVIWILSQPPAAEKPPRADLKAWERVLVAGSGSGPRALSELRRLSVDATDPVAQRLAVAMTAHWVESSQCYLSEIPRPLETAGLPESLLRESTRKVPPDLVVTVVVTVDQAGIPVSAEVVRSSGDNKVDEAFRKFALDQRYLPRRTTKGYERGEVAIRIPVVRTPDR